MLCCGQSTVARESSESDVYINIYDMTSFNAVIGTLGMGAHHTGVQVFNGEYCFGRGGTDDTGVYSIPPKTCEGHIYRETMFMGKTSLTKKEVNGLIRQMKREYMSASYHIVRCNCNDFSMELTKRLLGRDQTTSFPSWINRPSKSALWLLPSKLVDRFDFEILKWNKQVEAQSD